MSAAIPLTCVNLNIFTMTSNSSVSLLGLPHEVILEICCQLDGIGLVSLAVVNRRFNSLVEHKMLYRPDKFKRALVYSVKNSKISIANKVIRFGGNLDDDLGEAGLGITKSTTQHEPHKCLMEEQARSYDNINNTALGLATFEGNMKMIEELLQFGADPYRHGFGIRLCPWHFVMEKAPPETAPSLAAQFLRSKKIDTNRVLPDGLLPLHLAVDRGLNSVFIELVEDYFADINLAVGEKRQTAFLRAVVERRTLIIDFLLREPGLEINCTDINGRTALILAVIRGNIYIVERLLSKGINANLGDKWGQTALAYAVIQNIPAVLKPLLSDARVDLNIQNIFGTAPLSIASWYGDHRMVSQLLEYTDLDVSLQNKNGATALSIAEAHQVARNNGYYAVGSPEQGFVTGEDIIRNDWEQNHGETIKVIKDFLTH